MGNAQELHFTPSKPQQSQPQHQALSPILACLLLEGEIRILGSFHNTSLSKIWSLELPSCSKKDNLDGQGRVCSAPISLLCSALQSAPRCWQRFHLSQGDQRCDNPTDALWEFPSPTGAKQCAGPPRDGAAGWQQISECPAAPYILYLVSSCGCQSWRDGCDLPVPLWPWERRPSHQLHDNTEKNWMDL